MWLASEATPLLHHLGGARSGDGAGEADELAAVGDAELRHGGPGVVAAGHVHEAYAEVVGHLAGQLLQAESERLVAPVQQLSGQGHGLEEVHGVHHQVGLASEIAGS